MMMMMISFLSLQKLHIVHRDKREAMMQDPGYTTIPHIIPSYQQKNKTIKAISFVLHVYVVLYFFTNNRKSTKCSAYKNKREQERILL